MTFLFELVAKALLKGLSPVDDWKTMIGFALAIIVNVLRSLFGVEMPDVAGTPIMDFIYSVMMALGVGHKRGKVQGKAV